MSLSFVIAHINTASDWLLSVLAVLCTLGHLAVLRTPDVQESFFREGLRRIKIGGYFTLSLRWWYVLLGTGDLVIPAPTTLGLTLVLTAEVFKLAYLLFPHAMDPRSVKR